MNKQKRYISLLFLSTAVSGVKAMEMGAPQEEAKDKFAILKPKLSEAERSQLALTVNSLPENPTHEDILKSYKAALALEADEAPDARSKDVVTSRRNLWIMLKGTSADINVVEVVDYLSGSEDEKEDADESTKLNALVSRVHRRDGHLDKQKTRFKVLAKQAGVLKGQEATLQKHLDTLNAKKQPLDTSMQEYVQQEANLTQEQGKITAKQEAVQRVVENSASLIQEEPLLASVAPELLQPMLATELTKEKDQVAEKLVTLLVAKEVLSKQIDPLAQELAKLAVDQGANTAAQNELAQLLEKAQKAQALAQTDREKLLACIDQKIETSAAQRETLKGEVAELVKQVAEENEATQKATLLESKKTKDAEVAKIVETVQALKLARAHADKTYSYTRWMRGYYNGDN